MSRARTAGENEDNAAYATCLAGAVADVVQKQQALGIDIPDDGEFGKPVAGSYDYGAWWNYAFARMSGFSPAGSPAAAAHETQHKKSSVADLALTSFANRRDWQKFSEFYLDPESSGSLMGSAARRPVGRPACTGPIKYTGHAALHADIANLKKAMAAAGVAVFHKQWGTYPNNPLVGKQGITIAEAKALDHFGKGGGLVDGELVREFPVRRNSTNRDAA